VSALRRTQTTALVLMVVASCLTGGRTTTARSAIPAPEDYLGFRIGADNRLARWDRIVSYMRVVAAGTSRVRVRELGQTTQKNPFVVIEVAAPETMADLDRFKQLERTLYFQNGPPAEAQRDEIFRSGKSVVLVTCNIHSTEIGSSQMALELVHRLATEDSPLVRKVLDNVILLLVPSLNPDGQILVTDWFNKNLGTPFANSPMPWLYHPYAGHDNNRDMYMFTQRESQLTAALLWHDWFPSVWLDEHQMGSNGPRIFVMPATDPINPNVHPLIYRWNSILGQSQAAALEAAGKDGIIHGSTYTNFWQGAMAWSGWWHNEIGLLTEVASVRVASPVDQLRAQLGRPRASNADDAQDEGRRQRDDPNSPLPAPRDVMPRTAYPRPWLGGRWTLRDIVDYELIATMGLLEAAADRREVLLRHVYEVNRATVEAGRSGEPAAILIPVSQHEPLGAAHLVERLQLGGVEVWRADTAFEADGKSYPSGTFVIPMAQVFARYAKDLLEKQTYPEVRPTPTSPPEPPYDVTAWSLGLQMGVDTASVRKPLPDTLRLTRLTAPPRPTGTVSGSGTRFAFEYRGADGAIAVNKLLTSGAGIAFEIRRTLSGVSTRVIATGVPRTTIERLASQLNLVVTASVPRAAQEPEARLLSIHMPRVALYQPWTASVDEGWTRWVLEQYEFAPVTVHNSEIKAGGLRQRFDVVVVADQQPRSIVEGQSGATIRPEYRSGIGDEGLRALQEFVASGGTLVTLGAACDLAIERWPIPVQNLKGGLTRDQHYAPGTILRVQVDPSTTVGLGMPPETCGFYNNSPFFAVADGFTSQRVTVVARYPNADLVASGWLKGEEYMAGKAAVVVVETNPGRIVLFGLRPQHRAQTQATFPLLFNALYMAAADSR
jgi:hypothetical protein